MEIFKLKKSTRKDKKFYVDVPNIQTGRINRVHFGQTGYSDYTIHKDKERRKRYINRHIKDDIENPLSPGFWSLYVLWGYSTNIDKSFKDAVSRAIKLIMNRYNKRT